MSFCSILFLSILCYFTSFYSFLIYSILFYPSPFYYILCYSDLFHSTSFYSLYSSLFQSVLFFSALFYSIPFSYIVFSSSLFHSVLLFSVLFQSILLCPILYVPLLPSHTGHHAELRHNFAFTFYWLSVKKFITFYGTRRFNTDSPQTNQPPIPLRESDESHHLSHECYVPSPSHPPS